MLRTELYFLLLVTNVFSERIPATWNLPSSDSSDTGTCKTDICQPSQGQGRQKSSALGYKLCMQITLTVQNQDFVVSIDTGSSDTVLPYKNLNDYSSSASKITSYSAATGQLLQATYGDASWWKGYLSYMNVAVKGTTLNGSAPIIVATSQNLPSESSAGAFTDGTSNQGLMGFGYPALSRGGDTVVDSFFTKNLISKNQVAFLGCPPTELSNSYIDIGNDTSYSACGSSPVKVSIPSQTYHTLDVLDFAVAGASIGLPKSASAWQKSGYSIIDSCTTLITLPSATFTSITTAILNSGGFSNKFLQATSSADRLKFVKGEVYFSASAFTSADFLWSKLPSFSVTVAVDQTTNSNVTITLGPKQYLMKDADNYWSIYFSDGGDADKASLGYPYYASLYIVVDYTNNFMTFQPGCNCASATDGYPTITSAAGTAKANIAASNPTSSSSSTTAAGAGNNVKSNGKTAKSAPSMIISLSMMSIVAILIL